MKYDNTVLWFFYKLILYLWIYFGMAFIALLINLFLEYFKDNADLIKKEINEIINEKVKK